MGEARDPNIYDVDHPEVEDRMVPGYRAQRLRVGALAGSERLGTSLWTLPAGESAYPFHFHHVDEEQLIVLAGRPLLRDAGGWRRLERGAVVAFLPGEAGGHQVHNDGDEPVAFLSVSTNGQAETITYPEANLLAVFDPPPATGSRTYALDADLPFTVDLFPRPAPPTDIP